MKNLDKRKVVLGMSGGVDSSVALILLKKAGYDVIGVSLKYDVYKCSKRKDNVCCSPESFAIAKRICERFDAKHEIVDVSEEFDDKVIGYFKSELGKNRTPSPCVFCNRKVKFKSLIDYADKVGAYYVATGHYAKLTKEIFEGKETYLLRQARDLVKDQTYSLSFLSKGYLPRILFPLSDLTKQEVYETIYSYPDIENFKKIKQSQDFCFIAPEELDGFIEDEIHPIPGKIIDLAGQELGQHPGANFYTIGQRKKINLPGGPYYVVSKKKTDLIVSKNIEDCYLAQTSLTVFNFLVDPSKEEYKVRVKTRSTEELHDATLVVDKNRLVLKYPLAEAILTPGQIAVFYLLDKGGAQGQIVLGAGVIES